MLKDKLDEEYQRKTTLQSLMQASGMRTFKADLADCVAEVQNKLEYRGFINDSALNKLNFDLGRKAGLEMVLNLLQNYEDDLVGDDVKQLKK